MEDWEHPPPQGKVFKPPCELIVLAENAITGTPIGELAPSGDFPSRLSAIELSMGLSSLQDDQILIAKRARLAAMACGLDIYKFPGDSVC